MIKKSIAIILIILILINGIGCYSYQHILIKENSYEVIKGGKFKIRTFDSKVYYLLDVEVNGTTVKGIEMIDDNQKRVVEIPIENIEEFYKYKYYEGTPTVVIVVSLLALGGFIWFIVEMKEAMEN